jgi:sterol desaturase/sphingolipid hydroxylase (fatty acid hydroxylase superfamily)
VLGTYHYIALGLFAAFALADMSVSARGFPDMRLWRLRGVLFLLLYFAVATYSPLLWDAWLGEHRLFDATALPLWQQIAGGFVLLQFGTYCWHRTMHNVDLLWRGLHQMHHSAERIDIWSAFIFHPFDTFAFSLLASFCLVLVFGISGDAALWVATASVFLSMFTHANIRTPHWLGYIVTRPESHTMHHERGVHARNYGDVPWFDMLFGTFHNPRACEVEVGFYDGASSRIGAMLVGRKVA